MPLKDARTLNTKAKRLHRIGFIEDPSSQALDLNRIANQDKRRPIERMGGNRNLTQFGLSHRFTFTHALLEVVIKLGHNC